MKLHSILSLAFIGLSASVVAAPAMAQSIGSRFACESNDGRYRECAVDARAGVQLVRQTSRTACIEGQTWGVRRNAVWVDRGCRAEFQLGGYGSQPSYGDRYGGNRYGYGDPRRGGYGGVVMCESPRNRHNRCPIDTRSGVTLVRQTSNTQCREGHNWGYDRGEVWVDHGCSGEFAAGGARGGYGGGWQQPGYGQGYGQGYGSAQTFACGSNDGRQNYCRVNVGRGVELLRQTSRSACVQGQSWGWDRGGVWVSNGCRGEFRAW